MVKIVIRTHETTAPLALARQLNIPWRFPSQTAVSRMRRLGDIAIAAALLVMTFPLLLIIGVAIKCDSPGPVFERHQRIARGARRVPLLTFRRAVHDPADRLPAWAQKPTRIGAFLRYTRMDALPQLINALRGDISLLEADGWPNPFWD